MTRLKVLNATEARFDCVYPTCGGVCCHAGRPVPESAEVRRITDNLDQFLPHLRPAARRLVDQRGFMTRRRKSRGYSLAVVEGSCVFYNDGCVLHKVGGEKGDRWQYKPWHCITFPLERDGRGGWYVRQLGQPGEQWTIDCLSRSASPRVASDSLAGEIASIEELEHGREAWRFSGDAKVVAQVDPKGEAA